MVTAADQAEDPVGTYQITLMRGTVAPPEPTVKTEDDSTEETGTGAKPETGGTTPPDSDAVAPLESTGTKVVVDLG